ncbi:MAG: glycerol-3-phosphate dehydrogenase [Alphaproteobacteria bacterium]|nr:glycerol-3-phosphate dehydrogenase [Alphaproteobacteria bacterium]
MKEGGGSGQRQTYDLLIVGGGINGCGIARDAAGRGLSVLLCEKADLGGGTSSASTKLIHGGLRYLEHYEFRLVRESLLEREVLLRMAPHIIWPLRFVLPHVAGLRPAWMVRLGLFAYDYIGGRKMLPPTETVNLRAAPHDQVLEPLFRKGFAYSDCWVQDARLVVLNAMDAAARGASVLVRTSFVASQRDGETWQVELRDERSGLTKTVTARAIVNAAGPWAGEVYRRCGGRNRAADLRLVKGSHVVVRRLFDHDKAYILQNPDRRIVFAIPYERDFTLIGTTDVDYKADPDRAAISEDETQYLCDTVNRFFRRKIAPKDVVWAYSGVRPLYDEGDGDASSASREYVLELDSPEGRAPALHVFGGKITTYRKLAEHALDKLRPALGFKSSTWSGSAPLPGGDIAGADFDAFLQDRQRARPWMPKDLAWRLARNYGTCMEQIVGPAKRLDDLGEDLGGGLYESELAYLTAHEWVSKASDALWRRSKMGLHVPDGTADRVQDWLDTHRSGARSPMSAA